MSKIRKIILISLVNITIVLWLALIFSVFTHKEDATLINYKSPEEKQNAIKSESIKKSEPKKEDNNLENEYPGF